MLPKTLREWFGLLGLLLLAVLLSAPLTHLDETLMLVGIAVAAWLAVGAVAYVLRNRRR